MHLGAPRVGQPVGERGVVLRGHLRGVEPGRVAVARGQRDRRAPRRVPARQDPCTCDADPVAERACSSSQRPDLAGAQPASRRGRSPELVDLLLGLQASRRAGRAAPGTRARRTACAPRAGPTAGARGRSGVASSGQVAHQRVEVAVADHVAEVGAQGLALLAGDLVGVGDDVVEAVVLVDPLGGVALARRPGRRAGCRRSPRRARRARGSGPAGRRTSPRPPPGSSGPGRRRRASGRARSRRR